MNKRILHLEASPGWGGQELRILKEAEGMRKRGYEITLGIQKGGGLVEPAREAGFTVYELEFKKKKILPTFLQILRILKKHRIDLVNTHSSLDSWIGGFAAKFKRTPIVRTRHLSTPIRKGLNSRLLYNFLADSVVTTCEEVVPMIKEQAKLDSSRCLSIPTGVNQEIIHVDCDEVAKLKASWNVKESDILVGTLCILRSWKGISDLLQAAALLKDRTDIKWVIIGNGVSEDYFKAECQSLGLSNVIFAGYIHPPYNAIAALDIFTLLSRAHEGVSQASLQAAWLKKPLITTRIGGLKEVCLDQTTGCLVDVMAPSQVAAAVLDLANSKEQREFFGLNAHQLIKEKFTLEKTLQGMEQVYQSLT